MLDDIFKDLSVVKNTIGISRINIMKLNIKYEFSVFFFEYFENDNNNL